MPKQTVPKNQMRLYDYTPGADAPEPDWQLPNLTDVKRIALDSETTGLQIWKKDVPIGISISLPDASQSWYIPWGHNNGFNYEFENVKAWAKANLRDKDIDLCNAKFDFNMLLKIGIDLESSGNRLHEIMHYPALLDAHRKDYSLDALAFEELGKNKIKLEGDLERFPMQERNSAAIWQYACCDAELTAELARHYENKVNNSPMEEIRGLTKVLAMEDKLLFAVSAMERNGVVIDVDRLTIWKKQINQRVIRNLLAIYSEVGFRVEPSKNSSLARLFNHYKIEYPITEHGNPSFKGDFLSLYSSFPAIRMAQEVIQLHSLESKFVTKYLNAADSNNRIRYALHQLKASNTENSSVNGTVTGRFASSGGGKAIGGINIQQVFDDEKQEKIPAIKDFPIRDIFQPEAGQWLSADARQIEFRLFAHFTEVMLKTRRITDAYRRDPLIDFHDYIGANIIYRSQPFTSMLRKKTKTCNFGRIYGLGVKKLSEIYLHVSQSEGQEIFDLYNKEFPEAGMLLQEAGDLARSRDTRKPENRGWVKTMMGRLRIFTDEDSKWNEALGRKDIPYYSALNAVIQGTAADIMKQKIIALYDTREETGFNQRFTVHDEVDGDIPLNEECAKLVKEILDTPVDDKLRVPILWQVSTGPTWAQVKDIDEEGK